MAEARSAGARLRALMARDRCVVMSGCHDALSARVAESVGFEALAVSGFSVEAALLGRPDLGLMTMTELVDHCARITSTVNIPVISDADTGFGGIHNIARTIREMERAGIAGVHIEDQLLPKRCPALDGRVLASDEEAVARIRAACAARSDPDFLIIARCDGDAVSFDESVRRSRLYLEAGADAVLPMMVEVNGVRAETIPAAERMRLYRDLVARIGGPAMGLNVPEGFHVDDMVEAGFRIFATPALALVAAANAMREALTEIRENGTGQAYFQRNPKILNSGRSIMELMHLDEMIAFETEMARPQG